MSLRRALTYRHLLSELTHLLTHVQPDRLPAVLDAAVRVLLPSGAATVEQVELEQDDEEPGLTIVPWLTDLPISLAAVPANELTAELRSRGYAVAALAPDELAGGRTADSVSFSMVAHASELIRDAADVTPDACDG